MSGPAAATETLVSDMQTTEGPLAIGGVWAEAPDSNLFYATQRSWLHAASRVFLGLRLRGAERIPATGGVMLVANHVSYLDPTTIALEPGFARDVRQLGHWGTGDVELLIKNHADLDKAKGLIQKAYEG